ncbi:phage GP46 family protein [Roseomonas sp. HJA6]|uniref:Phage GP46 family protein n=1 Tax=Roseomonas alba TaxID=2846776 RepID=A0ABS7AIE3_9PROT|nr:phage GP46 family protein [Neoroseomonas alba]MBW6402089.1 phage GP46 family protein [Neoroseomonas alba]
MLDFALRFDPSTGTCDFAIEGGDIALDATPATPMLIALGSDRRARPDDALPDEPRAAPDTVTILGRRRGWPGDALDRLGRLIGSRLWLLVRAKQTEDTRRLAITYAEEALASHGIAASVDASWIGRDLLGMRVVAGDTVIELRQVVGQ